MAVAYFDSSAFVKLVVDEDGSDLAAAIWNAVDAVVSNEFAYLEVRAALAAAERAARLNRRAHRGAAEVWERFWAAVWRIQPTPGVVRDAAEVAVTYGLRAADALHLASAFLVPREAAVVVTWDERLGEAGRRGGFTTAPSA